MNRIKHIMKTGPLALIITACSGGGSGDANTESIDTEQDIAIRAAVTEANINADPTNGRIIPSINDPLPQLGMKLFFSKSLGGGFDSSCASCHHPTLGGADALSLSIGVDADNPDQLGIGRTNSTDTFPVPRNAPNHFQHCIMG